MLVTVESRGRIGIVSAETVREGLCRGERELGTANGPYQARMGGYVPKEDR